MAQNDAVRLAIRCARDSMPPLRLAILDDIAAHPSSTATDVRRRLHKPRATADRHLQALHFLGVLEVEEVERDWGGRPTTSWLYSLAEGINPDVLNPSSLPDLALHASSPLKEESGPPFAPTAKSGNGWGAA